MLYLAAVLSAWLQYGADGLPHARAVTTTSCPAVIADGRTFPMRTRATTSEGFADTVCDVAIPANAKQVRVEKRVLPAPVSKLERIVVLGDTGCRIKGISLQNCNDPEGWQFPDIARTIAGLHPDLIIHVGDYLYRETACPPLDSGCAGSPHGDISQAWNADWFTPAAPMFASAPLVLARGNHEECKRNGPGWFRYLDARAATTCETVSPPYAVDFPGLRLAVFDSAAADDQNLYPDFIPTYKQHFAAAGKLMAGASGDKWFLTHRPPYLNANERNAMGSSMEHFSAVLAGHIHLFAGMNVQGQPPLIINGEGGDNLDTMLGPLLTLGLGNLHATDTPFTETHFGFALYTRTPSGRRISLRSSAGKEIATCALTRSAVHCAASR